MSSEAWAAWAQAILSFVGIIVAVLVARRQSEDQARQSHALFEREAEENRKLANSLSKAALDARVRPVVAMVKRVAAEIEILPARMAATAAYDPLGQLTGFLAMRDQFARDRDALIAIPLHELPNNVLIHVVRAAIDGLEAADQILAAVGKRSLGRTEVSEASIERLLQSAWSSRLENARELSEMSERGATLAGLQHDAAVSGHAMVDPTDAEFEEIRHMVVAARQAGDGRTGGTR